MRRLLAICLLAVALPVAACSLTSTPHRPAPHHGRLKAGYAPCIQLPSGSWSCRGLDNVTAPAVTGTTTQGSTLTSDNGTWNSLPNSFGYQWWKCDSNGHSCNQVNGATQATYTLAAGDVGNTLLVRVTATNQATRTVTTADSSPTAVVTSGGGSPPVLATQPIVTGDFQQGQTLTATNGTWTNSPSSYGYQWIDCNLQGVSCSTITGATSSTYTTVSADKGHSVRAVVTATNGGGSASFYSNASGVITAPCTTTYTYSQAASSLSGAAASAAPGSVFCISSAGTSQISLESGQPSGMVYLEPAPGASKEAANWRVDNGGGNVTIENFSGPNPGGWSVVCTGGAGSCNSNNVDFLNNTLPGGEIAIDNTPASGNFYVARNLLYNCGLSCDNNDAAFLTASNNGTANCQDGIVFAHNSAITTTDDSFGEGSACGTAWDSNDAENVVETFCSGIHCDGFQDNGGSQQTTLDGNYLNNTQDCITAFDGTSTMTITDNVCVNTPDNTYQQWQIGSAATIIVKHNDKLDASGGSNIGQSHCSGANSSNVTVTDDIQYQPLTDNCNGTSQPPTGTTTIGHNLCHSNDFYCTSGGTDLNGDPTFTGGTPQYVNGGGQTTTWGGLTTTSGVVTPSAWTFFQQTGGSAGHNAAGDGGDIGVPASYFAIGTTAPSGTLPGIGG